MPGNIGLPEILIVLIIALVVFGPKRLPELGRSLGNGMREFKSSLTGEGKDDSDDDDEPRTIENGVEESAGESVTESATAQGGNGSTTGSARSGG